MGLSAKDTALAGKSTERAYITVGEVGKKEGTVKVMLLNSSVILQKSE